jgi:hypothetical protein
MSIGGRELHEIIYTYLNSNSFYLSSNCNNTKIYKKSYLEGSI